MQTYDSVLILSFGGPEQREDVIPFLENVLRGKNVPRERLLEVAEHYYHFGGRSPINGHNRELVALLQTELERSGLRLPVYWGNRNWHPFLADTLKQMAADGRRMAIAYVTSAFSSYSGCRQYREDIAKAQAEVGAGAPCIEKLRVYYNHPDFIEIVAERVAAAFARLAEDSRAEAKLLFTAHSIPQTMAQTSNYELQLREACRLVSDRLGYTGWELVYQSRSGPPQQPWLEPGVLDAIRALHAEGTRAVVLSPIGFVSDHLEVQYDLDTEARRLCDELGLEMERAATPGSHPMFVALIRELIEERIGRVPARAIGLYPANHDVCPAGCCPAPVRTGRP